MEAKHLEQLLGYVPGFRIGNYDKEKNHMHVYTRLRLTELGYEELERQGIDVKEKLEEVRFQIVDLILHTLYLSIKDWEEQTVRRKELLKTDSDEHGFPEGNAIGIITHAIKAMEYLQKICPYAEEDIDYNLWL